MNERYEKTWEEETLELIQEFELEKKRAIQRVDTAKRAVESCDQKLIGLKAALDGYRQKYGLPKSPIDLNEALVAEFEGMSPEEMINHRADIADNLVVMNDLVKDAFAAGMFTQVDQGRSTLYHTIARMQNYEKERPGVYKRIKDSALLNSHEHQSNQVA